MSLSSPPACHLFRCAQGVSSCSLMQPCPVHLRIISSVARDQRRCTAPGRSARRCCTPTCRTPPRCPGALRPCIGSAAHMSSAHLLCCCSFCTWHTLSCAHAVRHRAVQVRIFLRSNIFSTFVYYDGGSTTAVHISSAHLLCCGCVSTCFGSMYTCRTMSCAYTLCISATTRTACIHDMPRIPQRHSLHVMFATHATRPVPVLALAWAHSTPLAAAAAPAWPTRDSGWCEDLYLYPYPTLPAPSPPSPLVCPSYPAPHPPHIPPILVLLCQSAAACALLSPPRRPTGGIGAAVCAQRHRCTTPAHTVTSQHLGSLHTASTQPSHHSDHEPDRLPASG